MKKKRIDETLIFAYSLKNALEHEGKARKEAVLSSLFHEGLKKNEVKKILPEIQKIVDKINKFSLEEQEKKFSEFEKKVDKRKERQGLPELPNVKKKKVIMRFAPSPSGPLHIGNAITACISFLYVQKYKGKFYVRIEDTNPENIYPPAYKMIEQDSKWLFNNKAIIIIQSNRMKLYYKYLGKLLKSGKSYVCICKQEEFKQFSLKKQNCPCRDLSVKENLARWKKMLNKSKNEKAFEEGEAVLRFKSGMKNKNPAFRDFPLARINLTKHPLQKNKYRVWPLMNLAVSVDDIEQKMTHVIRGKDHRDNAYRQKLIFEALGKEKQYPWTAFTGRYNFKDMQISKTHMREGIEKGKYKGWDDERLPTLISLKKQGYKHQAFWKLTEQIGLSEVDKVMSRDEFFKLLRQFNK